MEQYVLGSIFVERHQKEVFLLNRGYLAVVSCYGQPIMSSKITLCGRTKQLFRCRNKNLGFDLDFAILVGTVWLRYLVEVALARLKVLGEK